MEPLDGNNKIEIAIDILMQDYESIRSEIRLSEARHEKVSLWLSSGLLAATAACFEKFKIGFTLIPLVILSYWAHRFYSHTLHTETLSQWIKRIEELIDKLLNTKGLLDWERTFVRQNLKNLSISSFMSKHYIVEGFLLLPSFVVFVISIYYGPDQLAGAINISVELARKILWGSYLSLFLIAIILLVLSFKDKKALDNAREASVMKTYESLLGSNENNQINK